MTAKRKHTRLTLAYLVQYCAKYATSIYVRAEVGGKWDTCSLAELPFVDAMKHIQRWYEEGKLPARMLEEGE